MEIGNTSEEWRAPKLLKSEKFNPDIIINSRLKNHGDYETPNREFR
jgi:alpha-L-fucosidase